MNNRFKQLNHAAAMALIGACAFWVPDVLLHMALKNLKHINAAIETVIFTIVPAGVFMVALLLANRHAWKSGHKYVALSMLAGVWLLSMQFMTITLGHGRFFGLGGVQGWLYASLRTLQPTAIIMFSAMDETLLALLVVTIMVPTVWAIGRLSHREESAIRNS